MLYVEGTEHGKHRRHGRKKTLRDGERERKMRKIYGKRGRQQKEK